MVAPPRGEAQLLAGAKVLEDIRACADDADRSKGAEIEDAEARGNMADENEPPPESKLTRSKVSAGRAKENSHRKGLATRGGQRLPPGQHLTRDWPTLDLGLTPNISRERWRLDVYGAVGKSAVLGLLRSFPRSRRRNFCPDIHWRHHLVALRQSVGGTWRPAICSMPAGRGDERAVRGAAFP